MKAIKIYLVIVTVLLIGAIGLGVYVWYMIQQVPTGTGNSTTANTTSQADTAAGEETTTAPSSTEVVEPVVIQASELTETQQKMLETMGYTQESFTITPAMITCAENAVGKTRLDEIMNGAAPGPLESVKLLPCFKQ
jgi:flagellar basal body-associated protein FliL